MDKGKVPARCWAKILKLILGNPPHQLFSLVWLDWRRCYPFWGEAMRDVVLFGCTQQEAHGKWRHSPEAET